MKFQITGLDHVQLAMPAGGEAAAEDFYAGKLGFTRILKPEPMAQRGGCWFETAGATVHLGVDPDFRPAKKAHPALRVHHLGELEAALRADGIEVRPNLDRPAGTGSYVDDPFGNRIELMEDGEAG